MLKQLSGVTMSRWRVHTVIILAAITATAASPKTKNALRVEINIPAARLDLWAGDYRIASHPVAVGTAEHPTPTGQFKIYEITWNPWWYPPGSDWAREEKPMRPGPTNPMGQVKLEFAPLYFIHGTPDSASVGSAGSHGCVRMHNADALALAQRVIRFQPLFVLAPTVPQTRVVSLTDPVPVIIKYERIEADDSTITLHPDPYQKGAPDLIDAKAVIERAGPGVVDEERLAFFLALPSSRRFIVSRSSLMTIP